MVAIALMKALVENASEFPYRNADALFTRGERAFLAALDEAAGQSYRVFGKVRLGDLINVVPGLDNKGHTAALNRIQSKHIDFVLCRKNDYSVAFAVELDDRSHNAPDRRRRDEFLDQACKAAGLTLLHFPARSSYDVQEIRKRLTPDLPAQD
jgi:hypothetical protein